MNKNYAMTMLYAYPYIDSMVKRLDDKILLRAIGSMTDFSPCEEQCAQIVVLIGHKHDLQYLKEVVEKMVMKFSMEEFDYFDYKYFKIRPKEYYEKKIPLDRRYYRIQDRLLEKFCTMLTALGGSDEWFEDKYLSNKMIRNLHAKVIESNKKRNRKKVKSKNQ